MARLEGRHAKMESTMDHGFMKQLHDYIDPHRYMNICIIEYPHYE
jgi:hypothetical protein